ncbi:hypothetical protein ALC57_03154 [Trachymyrmex cornetzi]|uniref:DNA-directed DNA polymerase n=1 Tax=Trachymyrmex cornetzi TaxID=471704 RepID=A0A151JMD0_9HYME|nr:hypothetical protein ALC57_03154 [Trachymyrmex cornetzi]
MENHERVERELLEQCGQVATLVECFAWLQRCDECIERLEELCLTSAVINFNHIEPRRFLEDAREIVLERVRDAIERHGSVKVNTAFNGEFATKDKRTIKSINTKNIEIYRACTTSVRAQSCIRTQWIARPTCISWFARQLNDLAHRVKDIISVNVPMEVLSKQQWETYRSATRCHICEKPFAPDDTRTRDHCHITGKFRGPAHSNCNLNYKNSFNIPGVFHNLSGYDANFLIKEIATAYEGQVDVLPITKEKYISFTKHVDSIKDKNTNHFQKNCVKLRFIDSFKFLNTSLDKLASYLDKDKLKIVSSEFSTLSDEKFKLLTRKGVFPYEYVDCVEKLQDTRLPPRESFYSSLTGDTVSESDYAHAVNVWQRFSIRTLGEYSDLYLKTDVLLLANIFENFRESCVASYGLDPAKYYTLPGFTWDAMLKHTRVRFELFTDIDMVMFIERGIRGGLSQCSNRYAQANNKYMRSYDSSKPSTYLMYYDVNNLYGWAMCQPLPYAEFRWVKDVVNFEASAIAPDSPTGYILEVDLEYL